jgi:hypothetical protein
VPAAGGLQGDVIDQANADAEAELQIRLHQTDGRLLRAIEEALARIRQRTYGVCVVCKSLSLRLVWKRCPGRTSVVSARNVSTQPPNGVERTNTKSLGALGVRLRHGRGLWANSALTFMNARAAGRAGNAGRRTTRMNVRIQPELFAQNAGRKKCLETPPT